MRTAEAKSKPGCKPRWRPLPRNCSGQSLLEFALLLPILCLLLLGVIEVGRYAYISIVVGNAARAGAAYGAQDHITAGQTAQIEAAAKDDFQNNGQLRDAVTVTSGYICGCDSGGALTVISCSGTCSGGQQKLSSVQVTASGSFSSLFSYPGIPSALVISRTATLRLSK